MDIIEEINLKNEIETIFDNWKNGLERQQEVCCSTDELVDGAYEFYDFSAEELIDNLLEFVKSKIKELKKE